jgi:glucokinase
MAIETAINPQTGNPVVRTTPEVKIKRVYAHNGMVVIVGDVGGTDVENIVDRKEAIYRAQALSDMAKKAKYSSDYDDLMSLVDMFVDAIQKAKEQEGSRYKAVSVSMFNMGKNGQ